LSDSRKYPVIKTSDRATSTPATTRRRSAFRARAVEYAGAAAR
jgi:hypothetical protein